MKILFLFLFSAFAFAARAENTPDLKKLEFTAKRIESLLGLALQFTPPAGHHFNLEAPNEATQIAGKNKSKAQLNKALSAIKASWGKEHPGCEVTAQLYICDDKNTYCVPIKKTFSCKDLTIDKEVHGASQTTPETEKVTASSKEKLDFFLVNDAATAQKIAKTEKKLILIDFFGIWCPPCNVLDETVFSTPEFKSLGKSFVYLKMDADAQTSWDLKSKYNVKGYPTVMIVNTDMDEVLRIVGSRKPKAFYAQMRKALKFKTLSLADRRARADSGKFPTEAYQLAEMYLEQEDYAQSMHYFTLAMKGPNWTDEQKNKMLSATLGLLEGSKDIQTQKNYASLLESALNAFPFGPEAYDRADKLSQLAEDLKDEGLKNRALNAQFKNAQYLLKNPKLFADAELTEADLHVIMADVYENLKDQAKMKESYMKAYEAYTQQIKASGLDEKKERGHNLERIYCLYKAGQIEQADKMWEEMQAAYPEEFTFYYAQASALKDQGRNEKALQKAEKALQYAYGDNLLRSVHLVANLKAKVGEKKEALSLIDETLKSFTVPENSNVRTHRYISKLKTLREGLQ